MVNTATGRRIVAFVPDLFFAAKIAATAAAAGVAIETLGATAALERCRGRTGPAGEPPQLLILDLGAGEAALALARALRADQASRDLPMVGFFSHVEIATRDAGLAAGVQTVLPRSAFVARLPELLRGA